MEKKRLRKRVAWLEDRLVRAGVALVEMHEEMRSMRSPQQTPQQPLGSLERFLPPNTPPTLVKDVLGAVEGLLEACRSLSADPSPSHANEVARIGRKVGGLLRSAHGTFVEDCICNETTVGKECPVHGKHWAVPDLMCVSCDAEWSSRFVDFKVCPKCGSRDVVSVPAKGVRSGGVGSSQGG